MSLDFEYEPDTEKKKWEDLPPGIYTVRITAAMIDTTREPARVNWEMVVTDGAHAGRKLWPKNMITPKSKYFLNRMLQPFGMKHDKPAELPGLLEDLIGRSCKVLVEYVPDKKDPSKRWLNVETTEDLGMNRVVDDSQIPF